MRRFIFILLILIFSVWLGLQIAKDPGLAFFSYKNWSVEMPLWFALLSLALLLFLFYVLAHFFDHLGFSFYRFTHWLKWRRKNKSLNKTNRGLIDILEGDWKGAEYYLKEGLVQSESPLINYLGLAKAAHEQKAYDRQDLYLRKAHAAAPHAEVAIGLTRAQWELQQGKLEQALATLGHLRSIAPKNKCVLKTLERVYIHLADWKSLLNLVPSLSKQKVMTRDEALGLELHVYQELLKTNAHRDNIVELKKTWQCIPKKLQADPRLILIYASALQHDEASIGEAEQLIFKSLKKNWNAELATLYGALPAANAQKQLQQAELLLKRYPNQAVLLLSLGRMAVRCQLWGKAKTYFTESLHLEANAETYAEYGALLEKLGDTTGALQNYREGLALRCLGT